MASFKFLLQLTGNVTYHSVSSPGLSLSLDEDGENKVRGHVGYFGAGDDRVLSRIQAEELNQFPFIGVRALRLRGISLKEVALQSSLWGLEVNEPYLT